MTELEKQLLDAFEQLGKQYQADMQRLAEQNSALQRQVQTLSGQVSSLSRQVESLSVTLAELAES